MSACCMLPAVLVGESSSRTKSSYGGSSGGLGSTPCCGVAVFPRSWILRPCNGCFRIDGMCSGRKNWPAGGTSPCLIVRQPILQPASGKWTSRLWVPYRGNLADLSQWALLDISGVENGRSKEPLTMRRPDLREYPSIRRVTEGGGRSWNICWWAPLAQGGSAGTTGGGPKSAKGKEKTRPIGSGYAGNVPHVVCGGHIISKACR